MKKVLILILAMVLSFSVFALAACQTPCETHVDANHDGICDVCATENLPVVHADSNHDGKCDVCAADYREACADVNPLDGKCDVCGAAVAHTCVDTATVDGKCDICGADVAHTHVDAMHDGKCDICGTTVEVKHVDSNHDGVCDVCQAGDLPYEHVDADTNFKCDVCGKVLEHDCVDANTDCWCDVCEAAMHADNNHDGFCDVCDTSTGEPEHVYVEGVCSCGAKEEWLVTLEAAQDFLRASYIEEPTRTAGDFKVLAQVPAGEGFLPVTWTVELVSGGNADSVKVGATEGTETTIEIDEEQMDVYYKLIGTVTDSEGRKLSVSFDRELPNYNLVNWKDYVAAPKDYTLSVQGVVTALTGKSVGNTYNTIYIQDNDGGYYIYDMASDPVADGIKVGMTIKVRGTKDIYSGTHEVKEAVAEIVDQTIKTIEPVDYTTIYTNAQSLKAEDLVAKQGFLVTIKGVQITGQNLENGYFKFKLGDLESYIRISGSVCPLSKDDQTKFKADHSSHFGWTANATGVICVYDGAFYLTPVNANAFEYTALPQLDEAGEVAFEKGALTFVETIGEDSAIELPAKGVSYADVTIAWDFKAETAHDCASIADGKLHVELPAEATTITLVATLTSGSVTDTKEFVVAVDAASTAVVVHKAISAPAAGTYKIAMNTTPANGAVLYFAGTINSKGALETTDKADKAVDVVVEVLDATAGTYSLKVGDQYLEGYLNGTYKNIRFSTTAAAWTWNDEAKVFVCDIDGVKYYFGDRDRGGYANTTMALSDIKYITGDNLSKVGVSQFPGLLSNLVVKEVELVSISAPAAGTYKIAMNTTPANGAVLYFAGTINSKGALETTDKADKAVDVVVEVLDATAGTYSLKVGDQYLEGYLNGTYKNIRFSTTAAAWTWNDEAKVFVCDIDGVKYYFGDRDRGGYANTTMALSDIKYITGDNLSKVGVSQFPGQLGSWQFVQEGGSDVPAHTCESVCPICTGCLDSQCAEEACATKCSCVETEAPAAGTYVVEMYQSKKDINLYLTGEESGYYLATSESSNAAMTVTLAKLENGKYTIKLANGKYLAMVASGTHINAVMQETACEFTWNAKLGNFTVAFDGTEYFFGNYGDYTSIGTCKLSYASTNYQAKLVAPLAHTCESVCENCGGCLDSECTEEACVVKCACGEVEDLFIDASTLTAGDAVANTEVVEGSGVWYTSILDDNKIVIDSNKKSYEDFSFTQRIKLPGTMKNTDGVVTTGLKLVFAAPCKLTVYAMSGNSSATDRNLVLKDSAFVDVKSINVLGDQLYKLEYEISEAGVYYLGSAKSGINLYGIDIAYVVVDTPVVSEPYAYTFEKSQFSANGTVALGDVEWTLAGDGGYWGWDSNGRGQQLGSGGKPYKSLTLTSEAFSNVTSIKLNIAGASSFVGTVTVTVGGVQIGETITVTTSSTDYTLTSETPLNGEVVIAMTQTSSKAFYIKSIAVE